MYIEQGEYFIKNFKINLKNTFLIRMLYRVKVLFPPREN